MEINKFKQAYFTTNIADDNGNYYYPVFIPDNALVQYPLTEVAPDPSLGGHGLKFDWTANQWIVSAQDPTQIEIKKLQEQLKQQQTINLSLMTSAFDKVSSVLPNKPTTPNGMISNMQSTAVSAPNTASTVADSAVASSASADYASTATDAMGAH